MNIRLSSPSLTPQLQRPLNQENTQQSASTSFDSVAPRQSNYRSEVSERELRNLFHPRQVEQGQQAQQGQEIASQFPNRDGYDSNFLGRPLSLPKLGPSIQDKAAPLIGRPNETELKYTNFSIVMNKERRQAFYSAVNIDGAKLEDRPRNGKWTIDSRIAREHQLGGEAYSNNPIDRGHMVRRRDAIWGPKADQANHDTFAYTNAGLQHGNLNQKTWLDLENTIFEQAMAKGLKLTVLTGPVFSESDPVFDNRGRVSPKTKIPQEFWKVVVWNDPQEGLKGSAFIQSQKDYVGGRISPSSFEPGAMGVYQIPLEDLETKTDLSFGDLKDTVDSAREIVEPRVEALGILNF